MSDNSSELYPTEMRSEEELNALIFTRCYVAKFDHTEKEVEIASRFSGNRSIKMTLNELEHLVRKLKKEPSDWEII